MFTIQLSGSGIIHLLVHLGPLNCSDVRDKVFGGLGLYQSRKPIVEGSYGLPDALRPDYTRSPAHVLRDATRFCIDDQNSLSLLARYHYEQQDRLGDLPTWVPNWYRESLRGEPSEYPPQMFNAAGFLKLPETLRHPNADILSLTGLTFASISQYTPTTTSDIFDDIYALKDQLQRIRELFYSVQSSGSVLAMTLIRDALRDNKKADADVALEAWQTFQAYIELGDKIPPRGKIDAGHMSREAQAAADFRHAMRRCVKGQRFFTTTAGQVGIGPKALKTGDDLVILPGSKIPFALRKKRENYIMIGQVYVHGAMYGEVLCRDFQPPPQWTTFNIE